jgi:hypothetical protein
MMSLLAPPDTVLRRSAATKRKSLWKKCINKKEGLEPFQKRQTLFGLFNYKFD